MKIICDNCKHFMRDKINTAAGIGMCGHPKRTDRVGFYPLEQHRCRAHEPTNSSEISSKLVGEPKA